MGYMSAVISMLFLAACRDPGSTSSSLSVSVEQTSAHGALFSVSPRGAASLRCVSSEDPEEVHEVDWDASGSAALGLHGLLASTRYACSVTQPWPYARWEGEIETTAEDLLVPGIEAVVRGEDEHGGYTLFNHWVVGEDGDVVLIVDPEGRIRFSWQVPPTLRPEKRYEALPDVDVSYLPEEGLLLVGGGSGLPPRKVGLDGVERWVSAGPDREGWHHHHVERLPDGDILSLLTDTTVEASTGPFEGLFIEARSPETGEQTFTWDSQAAVTAGLLPEPEIPGGDAWHANSLAWVEDAEGPAVYVNLKAVDRVVRVDRITKEITWSLGWGLDFALTDAEGVPLSEPADWFLGQHAPEWSSEDGRLWDLLVYDNGSLERPVSRVSGFEVDVVEKTARRTFLWTERGWFEPLYGDVDVLPSGHILAAMGHCDCLPAQADRRSSLVEIDPSDGRVVWRLQLAQPSDGLYRAEIVDGCSLFHNRKYCPEGAP